MSILTGTNFADDNLKASIPQVIIFSMVPYSVHPFLAFTPCLIYLWWGVLVTWCGVLSYMVESVGYIVRSVSLHGSVELHGGECWVTWRYWLHGGM